MPGRIIANDRRIHHRGHENIDHRARLCAGKGRLGDSGDLVKLIAHVKCAADYVTVLAKTVRPIVV